MLNLKKVAICFSGHPRTFLDHAASWDQYFSMIRREYVLSIYFHSWADQGLLQMSDGKYVEGALVPGFYPEFQELIRFLNPTAFAIESFSPELNAEIEKFPPVILSSWQANRRKILSQLYSIHSADRLRSDFETFESHTSDVVVRMRFDAVPQNFTLNEIRYVADHPSAKVLFAPSPTWHVHPGGGGGCSECHSFFDANRLHADLDFRVHDFLKHHRRHQNDICDLFAVGSPQTMERYAQIYRDARLLNAQIQDDVHPRVMQDYHLVSDGDAPPDQRIQTTSAYPFDIEESPVFVPEKLIRFQMAGFLVVHGESVVVIQRR